MFTFCKLTVDAKAAPAQAHANSGILSAFNGDKRGSVAIIFAFSMLSLFSATGGAIDYAQWHNVKAKTQAALDVAALAGGRAAQIADGDAATAAVEAAKASYAAMKPAALVGSIETFTVIENDTVIRGTVQAVVPTSFLKIIGIDTLPVDLKVEAVLAAGGNAEQSVEISVMLDVTGSMSGQKIEDMKLAAKDLVDIVVWTDQSKYTSRIAIAPFSARVNVGALAAPSTGLPESKSTSSGMRYLKSCVTERTGTEAFTDAAPNTGAWARAYMADNNVSNSGNYNSTGACNDPTADEAIMPLTSDKQALKTRIAALTANGSTAGQLGIAWSWYLISPHWAHLLPAESKPEPYAHLTTTGPNGKTKLKKIAILMTDGEFNTYGATNYGDGSSMAATISANAVKLCQNMRAAGITVYTVGFDLGGNQQAINTLKSCASREPVDPANAPSYFYNVSGGDQLRGAFRDIALKIATLRLRS